MVEKQEPRQRIMDAAAALFARKGYGVVGVREVAREANVNISMISYYFEGKIGILRSFIDNFFTGFLELLKASYDPDLQPQESIQLIIGRLIAFMKQNKDEALVMFSQLPIDEPEIKELKAEKVRQLFDFMSGLIRQFGVEPEQSRQQVAILGPAFISALFSGFLFEPIARGVFKVEYDEAFYQNYVDILTAFLLGGIEGAQKINRKEDD